MAGRGENETHPEASNVKVDQLLHRLTKVKKSSATSWIACCPAHEDKTPSLSIAENDGIVLIHCHAQCPVENILEAVGLEFDALFPDRPDVHATDIQRRRRKIPAADMLECVEHELFIVALAASAMSKGNELSDEDQKRLGVAASRINESIGLVRG